MKKYILPVALTAVALSAAALFEAPRPAAVDGKLQARQAKAETGLLFSPVQKTQKGQNGPKRMVAGSNVEISEYGTPVEVLYEDFSLVTKGQFGKPNTLSKMWNSNPEDGIPWWNMKPGFTQGDAKWGCNECWQAGGMVAFNSKEQAQINTPILDVSASELSVLEFRCYAATRAEGADPAKIVVEAADTRYMTATWDFAEFSYDIDLVSDEWYDVRCYFRKMGAGKSTLYNIVLMNGGTVYIDDIRVSTIDQYVGTPQIRRHDDYLGESFVCRWDAVEGAEKYLVNVYEDDGWGEQGPAVVSDVEVTDNKYTFTGAESGGLYWYNVRAVKGDHVSYVSRTQFVWDFEAPVLDKVAEFEGRKYTASWNEVPGAEVYNYWGWAKRVPKEAGEFVVTDFKFQNLLMEDGNRPTWTHVKPNDEAYGNYRLNGGLDQMGWYATHACPYKDCLTLDAWWYVSSAREDAGLISPELDLSANGGKATLKLTLSGEFTDGELNGYGEDLVANCCVAVFAWDDALEDYKQVYLAYADEKCVPYTKWQEYTIPLENLTDRCKIGIYAISAPGNLYIKDLKLTQVRTPEEPILVPYAWDRYLFEREHEVAVPTMYNECELFHQVSTTGSRVVGYNPYTQEEILEFAEGRMSELEGFATLNLTGVETVEAAEAGVSVVNGVLTAEGAATLYDAAGRVLAEGKNGIAVTLPAHGVYAVKTAAGVVKVVY